MADPLGLINASGGAQPVQPQRAQKPTDPQGPSFKQVFLKNIEQVNDLQQDAAKAIEDLQTGNRDDVANVMIAKQKADMAFKMLLQVRNKLQDAYDEINQTRV
jgi:flagellar hook-basal body complex protein FliE